MKEQGSSAALLDCNNEVRKKTKEFVGENSQKLRFSPYFFGWIAGRGNLVVVFPWIFVQMKFYGNYG